MTDLSGGTSKRLACMSSGVGGSCAQPPSRSAGISIRHMETSVLPALARWLLGALLADPLENLVRHSLPPVHGSFGGFLHRFFRRLLERRHRGLCFHVR